MPDWNPILAASSQCADASCHAYLNPSHDPAQQKRGFQLDILDSGGLHCTLHSDSGVLPIVLALTRGSRLHLVRL